MSAAFRWAAALAVLSMACGDATGPEGCNARLAIPLAGGSCITMEDQGLLADHRATITSVVDATIAEAGMVLNVTGVRVRVFAGSSTVIPELGIGGRAFLEEVHLTFDPNSAVLATVLPTELGPLLAHELHHVARLRAIGFSNNLLGHFVNEGLADHFSLELTGHGPAIWAVALTGDSLDAWVERARAVWLEPDPDLSAWLFGTTPDIPRWAGYAIGFKLVGDYLAANPSRRASTLLSEPATSFIP